MNASELRAADEIAKKAKYQARLARVIVLLVGMFFAGSVGYITGRTSGHDEAKAAKEEKTAILVVSNDVARRNDELERALTERTTERLALFDQVRELKRELAAAQGRARTERNAKMRAQHKAAVAKDRLEGAKVVAGVAVAESYRLGKRHGH